MKINVVLTGRYKDRPEVTKFFKFHERQTKRILEKLSKKFRVRLPRSIILRPIQAQNGYYPYWGRAQLNEVFGRGWEILLCYETCQEREDYGRNVIEHECAHVIDYLMHGNVTHSERFRKVKG